MLKWPPPSKDKTSVENKRLFSPSPDDLRALVFDYLCHNSYTNTARAFVADSAVRHLDDDGDEIMAPEASGSCDVLADTLEDRLRPAERRKEAKVHILSGRVDEAIELIRTHFPKVLPPELDTPAEPLPFDPSTSSEALQYESDTSVDPTHLLLNLRILGFIEAARTVPLPYYPPGAAATSPPPREASPALKEARDVTDDPELSEQQLVLLHKAQKLYSEANCLPKATDRALYLKELAQVSALLAYPHPEKSIMAPYLAQDRREAVAEQIDRAILRSLGQSSISHIELCTRYTTTMWGWLHDNNVKLPLRAKWPPGVEPVGTLAPVLPPTKSVSGETDPVLSGDQATAGKKAPEKEERAPPFALAELLGTKG